MSSFKAECLCLLCSYRSIEFKQYGNLRKGIPNTRTYQATNAGLKCSKCQGFVCIDCIRILIPLISKDKQHHCSNDLLDAFVTVSNMSNECINTPIGFIGHCCTLDPQLLPTKPSPCSLISNVAPSEERNSKLNVATLSGCIFFPQFDLFVDSPFSCMDIHAVGAECTVHRKSVMKRDNKGNSKKTPHEIDAYLPARWHCVVSHEFATTNNHLSPKPNGKYPSHWKIMRLEKIKIKAPHNDTIALKVCFK